MFKRSVLKYISIIVATFLFSINSYAQTSTTKVALLGDSIIHWAKIEVPLRKLMPGSIIDNYGVPCDTPHMIANRIRLGHGNIEKTILDPSKYDVVIVLAGYNGLIRNSQTVIADLATLYTKAKRNNNIIIAMTIEPFGRYGEWTPKLQKNVDEVNRWILSEPVNVDLVIDLSYIDKVSEPLLDPLSTPERPFMKKIYTSDGLHLNHRGGELLAIRLFSLLN